MKILRWMKNILLISHFLAIAFIVIYLGISVIEPEWIKGTIFELKGTMVKVVWGTLFYIWFTAFFLNDEDDKDYDFYYYDSSPDNVSDPLDYHIYHSQHERR